MPNSSLLSSPEIANEITSLLSSLVISGEVSLTETTHNKANKVESKLVETPKPSFGGFPSDHISELATKKPVKCKGRPRKLPNLNCLTGSTTAESPPKQYVHHEKKECKLCEKEMELVFAKEGMSVLEKVGENLYMWLHRVYYLLAEIHQKGHNEKAPNSLPSPLVHFKSESNSAPTFETKIFYGENYNKVKSTLSSYLKKRDLKYDFKKLKEVKNGVKNVGHSLKESLKEARSKVIKKPKEIKKSKRTAQESNYMLLIGNLPRVQQIQFERNRIGFSLKYSRKELQAMIGSDVAVWALQVLINIYGKIPPMPFKRIAHVIRWTFSHETFLINSTGEKVFLRDILKNKQDLLSYQPFFPPESRYQCHFQFRYYKAFFCR